MKKYFLSGMLFSMAVMMLVPEQAMAGTGGTYLLPVWTEIVNLTQGTLGRIITILIVIGGIAAAVVRQSLWAFIIGLSAGVGLYNTPTIVSALVTGTL